MAPRLSRSSVAVAALTGAIAALAFVAPSAGAMTLRPCVTQAGWNCGVLGVPLDHAGVVPGRLHIAVAAQPARAGRGTLIALSGGPGQSSVADADSWASTLEAALGRYRLVVLDQRGTGQSGVLRCSALQDLDGLQPVAPEVIAQCQQRIGPRRAFYRTLDSVEDIEALRVALGVRRIALAGISYGTWVAQEYARRYPQHVDRLILDSVVGPGEPDALLLDTFSRMPRVLREQCAGGRCRGATASPIADLAAVATRLRRGPLSGTRYDGSGRPRRVTLRSEDALFALLSSADLNPYMQARLPGALAAAAAGDPAALLRLVPIAAGEPIAAPSLSVALNITTGCLDTALPYALSSPLAGRTALVDRALAAVDPALYAPWSAAAVRASGYVDDCVLFPQVPTVAAPRRALPDVRALLLGGRLDMRTPVENARELAALLPRASIVTVAGTGHDTLDSDGTGCIQEALRRFVNALRVGDPCQGRTNQRRVAARPPVTIDAVPGSDLRLRVLRAVLATADEARQTALEAAYAGVPTRGGGLRGGRYVADDPYFGTLILRGYAYVPGVRISGRLRVLAGEDVQGTVRVRGALTGTVRVSSRLRANGTLGGRQVRLTLGARSGADDAPAAAGAASLSRARR
ncbi:unannotated protein [freshwater metagenome]|uniref:Unannotated protein n=1 Tax=freshwater metagenome TaxID=449393 RepID=A0A6J7HRY6_9ZZZZ|nr:alpha/beta fold hydrolase [Actinomycetota bacterium]